MLLPLFAPRMDHFEEFNEHFQVRHLKKRDANFHAGMIENHIVRLNILPHYVLNQFESETIPIKLDALLHITDAVISMMRFDDIHI